MKLAIYGTGGSGRELYEIISITREWDGRWEEIVFIDDTKPEGEFLSCRMLPFDSFCKLFSADDIEVAIAIGEPVGRKALYDRVTGAGYRLATIIHPTCALSPSAVFGQGVIVKDSVSISAGAVIKDNAYINGISMIGHDVEIGEHCQISSHVVIAGNTKVGPGVYIGISACVRDHVEIGENAIIAMGAVVMKSVRPGRTAMGNPAREIAENREHQVFK